VLWALSQAQCYDPQLTLSDACRTLGVPRATIYRWLGRQDEGRLQDRVVVPSRPAILATPHEIAQVREYAEGHPELGYKRVTWAMVDENIAFLRPWMVYGLLAEAGLLGRRQPSPEELHQPPEPDHPDQRWHTDLMTLYFAERWFWQTDVLDSYSRYLVQCQVLLTARATVVHTATQQALDTLQGRTRRPGEPAIVHDHGPQYVSHEWIAFLRAAGATDVPIRPHHPQSNGRDERFHRTEREEVPIASDDDLYEVQERIDNYRVYYNEKRPHSALHYLRPIDYYRGNPAARLAEREAKLRRAAEAREGYWQTHS
jgi:transposase InsO family protein